MIKVAVVGATGYSGFELVRLLSSHPQVNLCSLTSHRYAGQRFSQVFPSMLGKVDLGCESLDAAKVAEECDFVFTALPHGVSQKVVPLFFRAGKKVLDLSADFRLKEAEVYQQYYGVHEAAELLKEAVYGLTEIHREELKEAKLVANPGCYPSGAIPALAPLLRAGWIDGNNIVVDAKSGVSGAGRGLSLTTHFCEANEACEAYAVTSHRHRPEMDQELSQLAGSPVMVTFTPHLVPMSRGILSTVYATFNSFRSAQELRALFSEFYQGCPFIRLLPSGTLPSTAYVRGSNFCDIALFCDERARKFIVITCLDNLGKGAAGQAVQNFNLMNNLAENTGLGQPPLFP